MKYQDFISSDHKVMLGKPVLAGTRLTVELILRKLGLFPEPIPHYSYGRQRFWGIGICTPHFGHQRPFFVLIFLI